MIEILFAVILIAILFLMFKKINFKFPWLLAVVFSVVIVLCFKLLIPKDENDYEGDLVPLKNEVKNIANYDQAVKLILASKKRVDAENKANAKTFKETGVSRRNDLEDSLYTVLKDRLRFPSHTIKIEGKDTTITFKSDRGDFYMRSNHKDEDANYTIFWHSIIYTNKKLEEFRNEDDPEDKPNALLKIKDKYYYSIWSAFEY